MKSYRNQPQSGELMPQAHKEQKMSCLKTSDLRYGNDTNPQDLERSNNALADYAKKHKMKY